MVLIGLGLGLALCAARGAFGQCVDPPCGAGCEYEGDACCSEPVYCGVSTTPALDEDAQCWGGTGSGSWPLQMDLESMFGPPELPPRTIDPVAGSMPLVSSVGGHFGSPAPFLAVPTQGGQVDLVFGRTLLQAIDFELPFGGATFRHVRTFGTNFGTHYGSEYGFWDWNGLSWMMGESPVFLIDAQPRWGEYGAYIDMPQPRCYLVADAHHAIPFTYEAAADRYVAPPWFDAITDYRSNGGARPTEFHVWLNRQSIKYTFTAHYIDPNNDQLMDGKLWHTPPPIGHGFPDYALLKSIEDRNGNRVEYEYCQLLQFDADCCKRVRQPWYDGPCYTCNQRGQIKSIKLYPAGRGPGQAAWTLLYYHQAEDPVPDSPGQCVRDQCFETGRSHRLRAIFVYEGDVDLSGYGCFTLPLAATCEATALEDWDQMEYAGAPANWVRQVEYTYNPHDVIVDWLGISYDVIGDEYGGVEGLLLRAVVRSKAASGTPAEVADERTTLYRYAFDPDGYGVYQPFHPRVESVFEPQTVGSMLGIDGLPLSSNELLRLDDHDTIMIKDPATGNLVPRAVAAVATQSFNYQPAGVGWCDWPINDAVFADLTARYAQGPDRTQPWCGGPANQYIARTGNSNTDGMFRLYYLRNIVTEDPYDDLVGWVWDGHIPYYYNDTGNITFYNDPDTNSGNPPAPPFDAARHVAIIDQIKPQLTAKDEPYDPTDANSNGRYGILSRRVVEMNAAGFVLRDRTFNFDDESGDLKTQLGYAEQKTYDENGRIQQIRTSSWGSEDNAGTQSSDGLIYFFEYDDVDTNGKPDELARTGVMLGTNGVKYYLTQYEHKYPVRPDLVSRTIRFATPVTSGELDEVNLAEHEVTDSHYEFVGTNGQVAFEEHVTNTGQETAEQEPIYTIRRARYDEQGRPQYQGFGQATVEGEPPAAAPFEFFYSYTRYDEYGRKTRELVDTASDGLTIADEFERVVADAEVLPPLEWATNYEYDDQGRPTAIYKPGDVADHFAYDVTGTNGMLEMWKYSDVHNGSTDKPVQIVLYTEQGRVDSTLQVHLEALDGDYAGRESYTEADIVSKTVMQYDEYGRPTGTETLADVSNEASAVQAQISYDAFGMVGREESPDGTITRTVRGMRGRVDKVFKGTSDLHVYWGTAMKCDQYGGPEGCVSEYADDMVLTEKWTYGDGKALSESPALGGKNATGKVVEQRRYQRKPTNQYFYECGPNDPQEMCPPNNEDGIGLVTAYAYDCRQRPVYVEERSATGGPLHATLTWYDHQDRAVLVADYDGGGAPTAAGLDARQFVLNTSLPAAAGRVGGLTGPAGPEGDAVRSGRAGTRGADLRYGGHQRGDVHGRAVRLRRAGLGGGAAVAQRPKDQVHV